MYCRPLLPRASYLVELGFGAHERRAIVVGPRVVVGVRFVLHHAVRLRAGAATVAGRRRRVRPSLATKHRKRRGLNVPRKTAVGRAYRRTVGVAALHGLGQRRFAGVVGPASHGPARVRRRRPFAAHLVPGPVVEARCPPVARAALPVLAVRLHRVIGARHRRGALGPVAHGSRRRPVATARPARAVFPTVVQLLGEQRS